MLRKERIKMILMCILISTVLIVLGGCMNPVTKSNDTMNIGAEHEENHFVCDMNCGCDKKIYEPDLCGSIVLVTLDKEVGGLNKVHDASIFGDIGIIEINDLSMLANDEALERYNPETFRQILVLHLDKRCKENVFRVVEYLKNLDFIESLEPNYQDRLAGGI